MRKFHLTVLIFLLLVTAFQLDAQTSAGNTGSGNSSGNSDSGNTNSNTLDTGKPVFPQWAKDLRRFDIIAFGSFPFAFFTATFYSDIYRWNQANGMDFSEEGRRYAPWPLKAAGAIEMTKEEFERTLIIAASISLSVALADFVIVKLKKMKERRRIESIPAGSAIINVKPMNEPSGDEALTPEQDAKPETAE